MGQEAYLLLWEFLIQKFKNLILLWELKIPKVEGRPLAPVSPTARFSYTSVFFSEASL